MTTLAAQPLGSWGDLGGEGHYVRTDVTNKAEATACVDAAVERWGTVDVVVNNAYANVSGPRLRFEWKHDDDLRQDFEMNTMAAFWTMNATFPRMRGQQRRVFLVVLRQAEASRDAALEFGPVVRIE